MESLNSIMSAINGVLWHNYGAVRRRSVTGVLFTHLERLLPVPRAHPRRAGRPGQLRRLRTIPAPSTTSRRCRRRCRRRSGLGNIGGVALAIALGGPGAVFWMWVIGFFGMALKLTEVTLSMLYRNTDDPGQSARRADVGRQQGPRAAESRAGAARHASSAASSASRCWSPPSPAATCSRPGTSPTSPSSYFGIPSIVTGIVLAILVGLVIIGGIKRIGAVAGRLVPIMVRALPARRHLRAGRQRRRRSRRCSR